MNDVTGILARYIVNARFADIPQNVRHEASRALLNALGCAIGSARHETVENALAAIKDFSGPPQAAVFGRSERLDALHAALINGISMHVLDYDDTHARAVHPSAPLWPALLAYAEWRQISGADLILAFVLGVETECRIALSVFPEHYDRGWHITGTAGIFGAAAAIGKLLGLNEQQMRWALGIAATQSSGLREMFGSMCKSLHPGRAAQGGMTAALMASKNFTSANNAIEGERGWAHVTSTRFDPAVITGELGTRFELMSNMYKPYACGLVVHAAIDGCIQLRNKHALQPQDIARVDLTVCPIVMELTAIKEPRTGLEGKFSIFHAAATAIVFGAAGEPQFGTAAVNDERVMTLRRKVTVAADAALKKIQARITVTLNDGRAFTQSVENALGTLARPMSDQDLEEKFRSLTDGVLASVEAGTLIDLCWSAETLADAAAVARGTVPPAAH